jgi:hypothetical protein
MTYALCHEALQRENRHFLHSGGRSEENRSLGFAPAFMDVESGTVYRACFRDGSPAPFHLLDGLPDEVVARRETSGRVASLKPSIISGFVRKGRFFTRSQAASWLDEADCRG